LAGGVLDSDIEGGPWCGVVDMVNLANTIAQLLLIKVHLYIPYWGTSIDWASWANVKKHMVITI
jgi:hypothetical protein